MRRLAAIGVFFSLGVVFISLTFAIPEGGDERMAIPWEFTLIFPDDFMRYSSVLTLEQREVFTKQIELLRSPWGKTLAVDEALKDSVIQEIESVMLPELFPPSAKRLVNFYEGTTSHKHYKELYEREKTELFKELHERSQLKDALGFYAAYKIDKDHIVIKGHVVGSDAKRIAIFVGREERYREADEVLKAVPIILGTEDVRIRGLKPGDKPIELRGLTAEFFKTG